MTRAVAIVTFPGFQLLDAAGPSTAFEIAERLAPGSYRICLLAPGGGPIASSSGLTLLTQPLERAKFDTVVVSGGDLVCNATACADVVTWLKRTKARRTASVCSGAYLLAEAGLLDGRRATTHWASTNDFARRYPQVTVDADRIFVRDGNVWTSAGITAGIDLALALIEDDLGAEPARRTAQQLVVFHRRPGGQTQFSALVELGGRTQRFAELIQWLRDRLDEPLTVDCLAAQAAMSPRNFARVFLAETGVTPARAVERLRIEMARVAVEAGHDSFDRIAEETGFGDAGRMRQAFLRNLGAPPQSLRRSAVANNRHIAAKPS